MTYHACSLDHPRAKVRIQWLVKQLKAVKAERVVVTGISGIVLGSAAAREANIPLWIVRKGHDHSHGTRIERLEAGIKEGSTYVIIDDFICSGKTIDRIRKHVRPCEITLTHVILFDQGFQPSHKIEGVTYITR